MVSSSGFPPRMGPASDRRHRIEWVAFPTRDRPEQLLRAVRSYAKNVLQFGHQPVFLIADDSASSTGCQYYGLVGKGAEIRLRIPIFYIGRPERLDFCSALAENSSIPLDVARFALLGSGRSRETIGANRNAILIQTLGSLVLSVDDDTICRVANIPHSAAQQLRLGAEGEFGEFWFFCRRESARRFALRRDLDVLGEHARLLGQPLSIVVGDALARGAADLDQMCTHLQESLSSGHGRICITLNGVLGDSGAHSSLWVHLYADPATNCRLSSQEIYRRALSSRDVIRQVSALTISHTVPLISTFMGLDNRRMLPPFLPDYRNDDGVFGQILTQMGNRYAGHLPWTLEHAPALGRAYRAQSICSVRPSDIILMCLSRWESTPGRVPDEDALISMGRYLEDLASRPQTEFNAIIRSFLFTRARSLMIQLETRWQRVVSEGHEYWAEDLSTHIRSLESFLRSSNEYLPIDLSESGGLTGESPQALQELVRDFGRLLCWWPAILDRAMKLLAGGQRLARELT